MLASPDTRPARSVVTCWASARTSLSLCEMKRMVRPCLLQGAQAAEQFLGLGRRQHGRRFVEDEDAGVARQRLEDLDLLLRGDRERRQPRIRVDFEIVARSPAPATPARAFARSMNRPAARLLPEQDVLGDGQRRRSARNAGAPCRCRARRRRAESRSRPPRRRSRSLPEVGASSPERIFIRVDLPAPFSPQMA